MDKISFTKEDKLKIFKSDLRKLVSLSNGNYYVNSFNENRYPYEILGYELAQIFGLKCAEYFLVEENYNDDTFYAVISKDLNSEGNFTTMTPLALKWYEKTNDRELKEDASLYFLWSLLEEVGFSHNTIEIIKMYIYDLLFLGYDRHFSNFGLLEKENGAKKIVLLDNEWIFDKGNAWVHHPAQFGAEFTKNTLDIKVFLQQSSPEFVELFLYYYNLITVDYLKKLIDEIEEKYQIKISRKEHIIYAYADNRKKLAKSMEEVWGKVLFHPLPEYIKNKIKKELEYLRYTYMEIDFKKYHVKRVDLKEGGHELIGVFLADRLNINTFSYKALKIDDTWYILSEYIPEFKCANEFFSSPSLTNMWEILEAMDVKKMTSIIKLYFFDLLFLNCDRHLGNFGFVNTENGLEVYAIDHEYLFNDNFKFALTENDAYKFVVYENRREAFAEIDQELTNFFAHSDLLYQELFKEMYEKVSPSVLEKIIDEIISLGYPICDKEQIMNVYEEYYEFLKKFIVKKETDKRRR